MCIRDRSCITASCAAPSAPQPPEIPPPWSLSLIHIYHGTNVGVPLWVATVLNLVLFQMLFAYMWPQVVLLDQPLSLTLKNSINCMIAFLPHALAAAIVQVLFWGVVILCMPLGLFLIDVYKRQLEKAIFNQSRRLIAEPAAPLDLIQPSDLEFEE